MTKTDNIYTLENCKTLDLNVVVNLAKEYRLNSTISGPVNIWYGYPFGKGYESFLQFTYDQRIENNVSISTFKDKTFRSKDISIILSKLASEFKPEKIKDDEGMEISINF